MILGIDIGAHGAVAVLTPGGELEGVFDLPVLPDGPASRPAINGALLADLILASGARRAFVEFIAARPGEGPVGAFAFGRSRGVIEGVLGAAGVRVDYLTPPCWKRAVGVPAGKDNKDLARTVATRRWPQHASLFARKPDIDRAEASLIAVAGLIRAK